MLAEQLPRFAPEAAPSSAAKAELWAAGCSRLLCTFCDNTCAVVVGPLEGAAPLDAYLFLATKRLITATVQVVERLRGLQPSLALLSSPVSGSPAARAVHQLKRVCQAMLAGFCALRCSNLQRHTPHAALHMPPARHPLHAYGTLQQPVT